MTVAHPCRQVTPVSAPTEARRPGAAGAFALRAPGIVPEASALAQVELFAGLPTHELHALARRMRVRVVPKDHQVIAQDDRDGGAVFFLLSGRAYVTVVAEDGQALRLREIAAGGMFGEIEAIDGERRAASVVAAATLRVAVMARVALIDAVTNSQTLSLGMLRMLARRVRCQHERLFELTTLSLAGRVAAELLRLARADASGPGGSIEPAPRQVDIANTIGARRESVAREFGWLMRNGLLNRDGLRLLIPSRAALAERAQSG